MYSAIQRKSIRMVLLTGSILTGLAVLVLQEVRAANVPPGCTGNGINAVIEDSFGSVVPGQTINYTVQIDNSLPGNCSVTNFSAWVTIPNGSGGTTTTQIINKVSVAFGDTFACPGDARCTGVIPPYVVSVNDLQQSPSGCPPSPGGGASDQIIAYVNAIGTAENSDGQGNATACKVAANQVLIPCLKVTKQIACSPPNGSCAGAAGFSGSATGVSGSKFCYSITVTNCGEVDWTISSVSDPDLGGNLTSAFPASLPAGQSTTVLVGPVVHNVSVINTLTVTATNTDFGGLGAQASATATANVVTASISCTKRITLVDGVAENTSSAVIPADGALHAVTYTITVTNNGQVALSNVIVSDPLFNNGSPVPCVPPLPAGGLSLPVDGSLTFVCTTNLTCSALANPLVNTNTVTAMVAPATDGVLPSALAVADPVCPSDVVLTSQCTAAVSCRSTCITRTPGFWFNHASSSNPSCATLLAAIQANGGTLDLGFMTLGPDANTALAQAEGFFWKSRILTGDGKKASLLCKARKQLAIQLIAALANQSLFGTSPGNCVPKTCSKKNPTPLPSDLIQQAQAAAKCIDINKIKQMTALLDEFNTSGESSPLPSPLRVCAANPNAGSKLAVDPTTQANCNTTCP